MVNSPHESRAAPQSYRYWLLALVVALVTAVAFQPSFDGQWLHWDDDRNFVENEAWRGLSARNVAWMFTTFHQGPYQPLSWLTLGAEYGWWGMDPRGYHVTNVVFQALTAVVFFAFARALFGRVESLKAARAWTLDCAAALAALLFAVHPLRVESVAWVTERRDVVSGLFFALTCWAYVRFTAGEGRARRGWFAAAHVLYALSLAAKGLGFPLPVALIVLDALVLGRWNGKVARAGADGKRSLLELVREKVLFFALAIAAAVLAWIGQSGHASMRDLEAHGLGARIVQSFYGLFFYVWKTIVPTDLVALAPLPTSASPAEARFAIAITAVCAVAALAWFMRRRAPALGAALLAYAILVGPVLGLTQAGPQLVADRYSYLPCMPLALLAAGALARFTIERPARRAIWIAASLLVLPLVFLTRAQAAVWHDDITLWTKTVAVSPTDTSAWRNLTLWRLRRAEAETDPARARPLFEEAIAECHRGLAHINDAGVLSNASSGYRSLAFLDTDRHQELLETSFDFARRAVEQSERDPTPTKVAYLNYGFAAIDLGRPAEAIPAFRWYADHYPEDPESPLRLAQTLKLAGQNREALVVIDQALKLAPHSPRVWMEKGDAHKSLGEKPAAIACIEHAIKLAEALPPELAEDPATVAEWRGLLATLKQP